jgi:DNA-binding transcriptional LysR family regulator
VSPTEAGERILQRVAPRFVEIEAELMAVTELRDKPAGTIRITATDHATNTVLWPKLSKVLHKCPEIKVEIMTDYGLTDIVADRYDIGIRHGDQVAKDMIAVRIAADMKMSIVGSPAYLENKPQPKKPQDLMQHNCINLRLPTLGGFYAWELKKGSREVQVRVEGQLSFNGSYHMLDAALAGYGLAYLPSDLVQAHVTAGRLVRVLDDWCPTFPGLHAYYASRSESSRALALVIDSLRYRPKTN